MKISRETLHQLIENKLYKAGLKREHAAIVADVLVYADYEEVTYLILKEPKGGNDRKKWNLA